MKLIDGSCFIFDLKQVLLVPFHSFEFEKWTFSLLRDLRLLYNLAPRQVNRTFPLSKCFSLGNSPVQRVGISVCYGASFGNFED